MVPPLNSLYSAWLLPLPHSTQQELWPGSPAGAIKTHMKLRAYFHHVKLWSYSQVSFRITQIGNESGFMRDVYKGQGEQSIPFKEQK